MARAATRDRLLATAQGLFYENGLAATGVEAVIEAAGVSKPTLYAHFGSKSGLVAAVLEQRHARRTVELREWVMRSDVPERPLAVFAWLASWYQRQGTRGCGFLNAAAELPDPHDAARLVISGEKRWLAQFLADLCRDAGLRNPARLGSQLLLLIDGVSGRVLVHGQKAAVEVVREAADAAALLIAAAADRSSS